MSLLGVDLGTSICKAAVFGVDGRCLAQAQREYHARQPHPEQFELDSRVVWQQTQEVIAEVALSARHDPISALCVSSFGEAMVPVSATREILGDTILCADARGTEYVRALEEEIGQEAFYRINPNLLGPAILAPETALAARPQAGVIPAHGALPALGRLCRLSARRGRGHQ